MGKFFGNRNGVCRYICTVSDLTPTLPEFSLKYDAVLTFLKIGAYKDLSNNLKSIMLILGFILEK